MHRKNLCAQVAAIVLIVSSAPVLAQSNATYSYDALGRLTNISYPMAVGNVNGTKTIAFAYDAAGNRTTVTLGDPNGFGNTAPVAANDRYVTIPQVATEMNVLWNDREPNQQALTVSINQAPTKGTYQIVNNRFIYTANPGASGEDKFSYWISDGAGGWSTAEVTVDISEITPWYYLASSNYGGFNGLSGVGGPGMRDARFGCIATSPPIGCGAPPPQPADTTHGTTNVESNIYIFADLASAQSIGKIVIAPISASYGGWGPNYVNGGYVSYSPDGINWYGSDENIWRSEDNKYLTINMADISARYIAVSMSSNWLGLGDFRIVGPIGATAGYSPMALGAVPDGPVVYAPPRNPPIVRRARFADFLPKSATPPRPANAVVAQAASDGGGVAEPETPPTVLASLPGGGLPIEPPPNTGPTELIPRSYLTSSQLYAGTDFDPDGMRDGAFGGARSVARTSTSSNEFVVADLGQAGPITRIDVAPVDGVGPRDLDGANVFASSDCERWAWVASINGTREGSYTSLNTPGLSARCIKIEMRGNYLAVGNLRVY